ncbi:MAG: DNA topoisomerase I [Ignisphaera sp.]|uniref:DNA topoisomerase n=1 Tax=Ignisphaera aggregans TaxID=334771 RepID=A0A7J3MZW1_9CREN
MLKLPSSYILVIAEKPRAAEKIAHALGKSSKIPVDGVPVWITYRNHEYYIIAPVAGHMYTLSTSSKGYPVYTYKWVPRYFIDEKAKRTKKFLDVIAKLSRYAKFYINACDYDVEGSLIGYMVIKNLGDERRAFRAKFSSLTASDIVRAFENLSSLDYNMIEAGYCRHVLDWLWGINISRALMDIYIHAFGSRRVLSAGRVQTPTLAHIVDIVLKKRLHVPVPLAYPSIKIAIGGNVYALESLDEPFNSYEEAQRYLNKVKDNPRAYVKNISVKNVDIPSPHPFNLPDLQSETHRILKVSPYLTQKIAEDLYLEALISYPRTNSQKLPQSLNNRSILEKLSLIPIYKPLVTKLLTECRGILNPNNGPKDDPAHPAIYPTGEGDLTKLSKLHLKLYDLIVRRYLATFANPMKVQYTNIYFDVHGRQYVLRGAKIVEKGWSLYYPFIEINEKIVPYNLLKEEISIPIEDLRLNIRYSRPLKSPTRIEILKWMESIEIGTEATRAEIVETLFKRGYVYSRSKGVEVSDLAVALVHILKEYVKDLVSVDLTRDFEKMLDNIKTGKMRCRDIEERARTVIDSYLRNIKTYISDIVEVIKVYVKTDKSLENACHICRRSTYKENLCLFHYEALTRIKERYKDWQKFRYGWREYLERICRLNSSGAYVKEVCRYVLEKSI